MRITFKAKRHNLKSRSKSFLEMTFDDKTQEIIRQAKAIAKILATELELRMHAYMRENLRLKNAVSHKGEAKYYLGVKLTCFR